MAETTAAPTVARVPEPIRHTDDDLVAALPRGTKQLHELRLNDKCLEMSNPCEYSDRAGFAFVNANDGAQSSIGLSVSVTRRWLAPDWAANVKRCPQGRFRKALKMRNEVAPGAYEPGEQGTSTRYPWEVRAWSGFICQKRGIYLWPEGRRSEPQRWQYGMLNNRYHVLTVAGRSTAEVRSLAREYLTRLEG